MPRRNTTSAGQMVYQNAGAPTNGTSGTLAGVAAKGALLLNTTNGLAYQNTNTLASPTWTRLGAYSAEMATLEAAIPTAAVADIAATDSTTVSTADGSDAATTQALANALKVQVNVLVTLANAEKAKINDLLAKLRTAGIITP